MKKFSTRQSRIKSLGACNKEKAKSGIQLASEAIQEALLCQVGDKMSSRPLCFDRNKSCPLHLIPTRPRTQLL